MSLIYQIFVLAILLNIKDKNLDNIVELNLHHGYGIVDSDDKTLNWPNKFDISEQKTVCYHSHPNQLMNQFFDSISSVGTR